VNGILVCRNRRMVKESLWSSRRLKENSSLKGGTENNSGFQKVKFFKQDSERKLSDL